MNRRGLGVIALTAAIGGLLGGCALGKKDPPPSPCPEAHVLSDAATITTFAPGSGRDLIDVASEGRFAGLNVQCAYQKEDDRWARLVVQVTPSFVIEQGPAATDRTVTLPYFVGITNAGQTILNKERFEVGTSFPGNVRQATVTDEPITLDIALDEGRTGDDYRIFTGFQLSREQIEYNRRRDQR